MISQKLSATDRRVLRALSGSPDPLHGYGIVKSIRALDGTYVTMASLYTSLLQLLNEYAVARGGLTEVSPGKVRQVYGITPYGRRVLEDQE